MINISNNWFVYLLECNNESYYTGVTKNVNKRVLQHNKGTASKYTRSHLPVKLIGFFKVENYSEALRVERRIKELKHEQKLAFFKRHLIPNGKVMDCKSI